MDPFIHTFFPQRTVFGSSTIHQLPAELHRLKVKRPLILTGPRGKSTGEAIASILSTPQPSSSSSPSLPQSTSLPPIDPPPLFCKATAHTPLSVTDSALSFLNSSNADGLISVGGGSAIGLGKALAVRTSLPHICVPTTYAGSECTAVLGETGTEGEGGEKKKVLRSDERIRPGVVMYDVDLTLDMPVGLSMTSGGNALAHAGE